MKLFQTFFRFHQPLFVFINFLVQPLDGLLDLIPFVDQLISLLDQQFFSRVQSLISLIEKRHIFNQSLDLNPCAPHTFHQFDPSAGFLIIVPDTAFIIPKGIRRYVIFSAHLCDRHLPPPSFLNFTFLPSEDPSGSHSASRKLPSGRGTDLSPNAPAPQIHKGFLSLCRL